MMLDLLKSRCFYILSKSFSWLYRRFPLFGRLRGSLAIIRHSDLVLIIDRNDGLGWAFPGGRARPGESGEAALRREVFEETGLVVSSCRFLFSFDEPIAKTSVFETAVTGELRGSWEGHPRWVGLPELASKIYVNHTPVLTFLQNLQVTSPK